MSLEIRYFWIVLLVSIVTAVFIDNGLSAQEESSTSATWKFKILSKSIIAGDITEIRRLIDAGADVNKPGVNGTTPLFVASQQGHPEVVKLLLEAGANVNKAEKEEGFTSLLMASSEGQPEVVRLLLEAGADVDKTDKKGRTPLIVASMLGHTEVVKLLEVEDKKADKYRNTSQPDVVEFLRSIEEEMKQDIRDKANEEFEKALREGSH